MTKIDTEKINENNREYLELLIGKSNILEKYILKAENLLRKVNYQIEKFYVDEEIYSGKTKIEITSKQQDKLFSRKIERYQVIIGLLSEKFQILTNNLQENINSLDPLSIVNRKLELFDLKIEIDSKIEFLEDYKKRINIHS